MVTADNNGSSNRFGLSRPLTALLLVAILSWPALHLFAIGKLALNPWEFGGWAMYSSPEEGWSLESFRIDEREIDPYGFSTEARDELEKLILRVGKYGLLGVSSFPVLTDSDFARDASSQRLEITRSRLCPGGARSTDRILLEATRDGDQWESTRSYTRGCLEPD